MKASNVCPFILLVFLIGCAGQTYPVPANYTVKKLDNPPFDGTFGRIHYKTKNITIRDYWFTPDYANTYTLNHEIGHAYGVVWRDKPWCLMWEGESWHTFLGDSILEKFAIPIQAVYGFQYCPKTKRHIRKKL